MCDLCTRFGTAALEGKALKKAMDAIDAKFLKSPDAPGLDHLVEITNNWMGFKDVEDPEDLATEKELDQAFREETGFDDE
jgi:hypothetical protein